MNVIAENKKDQYLLVYVLLLIVPAFFINLGLLPFILDEATRANVALEMVFSGDFIHPTINGELYFNKPPLYNWILVLFTSLTGNYSEFVYRLPTLFSLLFFGFTVYKTQKQIFGRAAAFLSAMALLSCGRILYYDSMKGLIDISFSWVIYMIFWAIYFFGKKNQHYRLFILVYILTAIAFLMKGLPALVFTSLSLLSYFVYTKKFRVLLRLPHVAAILLFFSIIGCYFYLFSKEVPVKVYFETLWSESSKRTFIDNSFWYSIKHLFLFPVDFIYHFFPWTLLLIMLLRKSYRRKIIENQGGVIFILLFMVNIIIYWLSPAIYPRYLFMFLPLIFGITFYILINADENAIEFKFLKVVFLIILSSTGILLVSAPLLADRLIYSNFWLKYSLILLILATTIFFIKKGFSNYLLLAVAVLFITRIAFNFFVLPERLANDSDQRQKNGAVIAGQLTKPFPLKIIQGTPIQHVSSFYIMRERMEILRYTDIIENKESYYIIEKEKRSEYPTNEVLFEFETRIEATKLIVVRFLD